MLVNAISGKEFREGRWIEYGSALIVVSALFSLFYSVKAAVVGTALIAYGAYIGNHDMLPPLIFSGFLCLYAGFQLGETRERLRQRERAAAARKLERSNAELPADSKAAPKGSRLEGKGASSPASTSKKRTSRR
jgi:hypothetical protein